jgi:hypothetical protein
MPKLIDMTGKKYGRWLVVSIGPVSPNGHRTWNCVCECGADRIVEGASLRSGNTTSCGCYASELTVARNIVNRREKSYNWKGGRTYTRDGYVLICNGEPGSGSHQREHRMVMEQHLGRKLVAGETVHHINGQKDDNRIENLELWCGSQPYGIRIADAIAHAKAILSLYCPKIGLNDVEEYPSEECVWL